MFNAQTNFLKNVLQAVPPEIKSAFSRRFTDFVSVSFLILQTNTNTLVYKTMYHTIEGNTPLPLLLVYDKPVCKHK